MTGHIRIDGYSHLAVIGRGGFASVYRAVDEEFSRDVAIKVLSGTLDDPDVERWYRRERHAMGRLSGHPNIVTVFKCGLVEDGRPYIVMELLSRGSLRAHLSAAGPMPWEEAVEIAIKLAGALNVAHREGVLHRDIKPENILMSDYGQPKLGDFGLATLEGATATASGVVSASIAYAAPEILQGSRATASTDVYSLAATFYTMILGRPVFTRPDDEGIKAVMHRVVNDPPPELDASVVPPPVAVVIRAAMSKDPAARPAGAAGFLAELAAAAASSEAITRAPLATGVSTVELAAHPAPRVTARNWPHRAWIAGAIALALLIVGGSSAVALRLTAGNGRQASLAAASSPTSPSASGSAATSAATASPVPSAAQSVDATRVATVTAPTQRPRPTAVPTTAATLAPTAVAPANAPPVLPAKSSSFSVPHSTWTTIVADDSLVHGWYDPDQTSDWLCVVFTPANMSTWGTDGADCTGKGLKVYADATGTYTMTYVAEECKATPATCGAPYSTQVNTITITVRSRDPPIRACISGAERPIWASPASPASRDCAPPSRTYQCAQSGAHPAPSTRTSIIRSCVARIGGSRLRALSRSPWIGRVCRPLQCLDFKEIQQSAFVLGATGRSLHCYQVVDGGDLDMVGAYRHRQRPRRESIECGRTLRVEKHIKLPKRCPPLGNDAIGKGLASEWHPDRGLVKLIGVNVRECQRQPGQILGL